MDKTVSKYEKAKSTYSTVTWSLFLVVVFFVLVAVMERAKLGYLSFRTLSMSRNGSFILEMGIIVAASAFLTFLSNILVSAICDHIIELHLIRVKMWSTSAKSKESKESKEVKEVQSETE